MQREILVVVCPEEKGDFKGRCELCVMKERENAKRDMSCSVS